MAFTRPKAAQIDFDATNISDSLIRINSSETGANANDIGIVFERGSHTNAALIFDESTDTFRFISTTHSGAGSTSDINISAHHALHVGGLTINTAYTFPTSDGSANQFLQTDGSGALSFATVTSSFTLAADSGSNDSFSTGQTLTIAGGTGIDTTVSDNNISIAIDSTVATLTGSQTLTNKTLTNPTINAFSGTGNGSITGTLSIVTTTTDDSLLITTTEDSSSAAPVLTLKRNSSSVADADYLGQIKFKGENDADQEVIYAKITGKILDASDGTEDGIIEFAHKKGGSNVITSRFRSDSYQLLNVTQLSVDGTSTFNGVTVNSSQTINMGSNRITTVADPTSAQDAATKAYVDSEIAGSSGDSVFSSDADFDAVTATATVTEDLSVVTSSATSSLDLGTISVQGIVTSTAIVDANVTTAKIADDAVTTAKIPDDAVTTAKIPDDAITSVKLSGLTNSSSGVVSADGDGTFSVSAGGSGLSNVVEDTTPQLGGDLASNGNNIAMADNDEIRVGSGNDIVIKWDATDGHITALGTLNIDGADGHEMAKFVDGGAVELYHNDVKKVETTSGGLSVTGSILPEANGTRDLGSASLRWQNIYTSDLNLNNGVGNYTVVEGEEDLFLYNNKSGKVFKFALIEVDPSEATPKIEDL
jgi:hypothetical protein